MSDVAVRFDNVSKRFILHHERYRSFQEFAVNAFRRGRGSEEFWALKDVSFTVEKGHSFGIVGENGSGKSTALKIISGILQPNGGDITVNGRLAALLELGSGFHPDLTGRENIHLNAALLGFSRKEIDRRMDSIIDFAELDRFIDTPLKHYSSGMQIRLGFAVAIHSDPDILITDEVLSVGDEAFQRKCTDRIDDLMRKGKTIILVSHGLDTVRYVCTDAIWLDHGRVRAAGKTEDVISAYLEFANQKDRARRGETAIDDITIAAGVDPSRRWGTREIEIVKIEMLDERKENARVFETASEMTVRVHYMAHEPIARPEFGLAIHYGDHTQINGPNNRTAGLSIDMVEGAGYVDYHVKSLPLLRGLYTLTAAIYDEHGLHAYDHHDRLYPFHVQQRHVREMYGMVWMDSEWNHKRTGSVGISPTYPIAVEAAPNGAII